MKTFKKVCHMFVHTIDPVLIEFGIFQIRYYGLIYVIGFILAYMMLSWLIPRTGIKLSKDQISDFVLYLAVGALLGARLLYATVYQPLYFLTYPVEIFFIWQGGLSFHGGLLGAWCAGYLFCRKHHIDVWRMADLSVIPLALALALGRIGNFINAELVGRITSVPWCVEFPSADGCRHPSQLYASVKNLILFFAVFAIYLRTELKSGYLFAYFLVGYGTARFFIEFFRQPDVQLGFIILGLSMGQILSIIVVVLGIYVLHLRRRTVA